MKTYASFERLLFWLPSFGLVLLATIWASFAAAANPPHPEFNVANTTENPVPTVEQNLDANGNIKVHEQGTLQLPSHLGVSGKDLVQINTLGEGGPPHYVGWSVLRGDGSITDYLNASNPLVPPEGTVLVITDFHTDYITTGPGSISLSISRENTIKTIYAVSSYATESLFANTYSDHMTTGIIVPPGWQLDLPEEHVPGFAPPLRLEGYFAVLE
jgi:hypothetical protein